MKVTFVCTKCKHEWKVKAYPYSRGVMYNANDEICPKCNNKGVLEDLPKIQSAKQILEEGEKE